MKKDQPTPNPRRKASEAYLEKLRDPRWQKMRLQILERDQWTCQECRATDKTLHVHHRWYERNAEPWEAPESALVTLCEDCHEFESDSRRLFEESLLLALKRAAITSSEVSLLADGFRRMRRAPFMSRNDLVAVVCWTLQSPLLQDLIRQAVHGHTDAIDREVAEAEETT